MTPRGMDRLLPPEGVPLFFRIAGLGVRMAAQITDLVLTGLGALALFLLFLATGLLTPGSAMAVAAMLFFFIRIPYYAVSELAWNGQTIGKRLMKIKVVSADGAALTTQSLVVRNLMKEAEIFLPGTLVLTLNNAGLVPTLLSLGWVGGVLAIPLFNRRRQRLGDLIAGTFVIHLPVAILLKDIAKQDDQPAAGSPDFRFLPHHLEHYGAFELQTLEGFLREADRPKSADQYDRHRATLAAVVEQIRQKIEYADAVPEASWQAFLTAFYKAQRSYLEQRQLFGEKRADKHHTTKREE